MKKLIFILPIAIALFSCKKTGCTDPNADNYSSENKKDDKSCMYSAPVIFWMDTITAQNLNAAGFSTVNIKVEGNLVGQIKTNRVCYSSPDCTDTCVYKTQIGLAAQTSQKVSYTFTNTSDGSIGSGNIELQAGSCNIIEVNY
jgi:hypothetical protein